MGRGYITWTDKKLEWTVVNSRGVQAALKAKALEGVEIGKVLAKPHGSLAKGIKARRDRVTMASHGAQYPVSDWLVVFSHDAIVPLEYGWTRWEIGDDAEGNKVMKMTTTKGVRVVHRTMEAM